MDPIISFILDGVLPSEAKEVEKIRWISAQFWLFKDKRLYRLSFGVPYLLCLHPGVVKGLLTELQEGICDSHMGGRSLAHRVMIQRFWWPNMQRDAAEYVKKCDRYQKHTPNIHQLGGNLNPISNPWPFAQ